MGVTFMSDPPVDHVGRKDSDGNVWLDYKAPFFGRKIDVVSGHLDYDKAELGINFDDTSRYNDNDQIGLIMQLNHDYKLGSNARPHMHWFQSSANIPNFMIKYRAYNNGDTIPSWTIKKYNANLFAYSGGTMLQIMTWPEIDLSSITDVSGFVDIKIFRDTANASGLFAGADPLTGNALTKEFDLHVKIDMLGSRQEYAK